MTGTAGCSSASASVAAAAGGGRPDYLCPQLVAAALADMLVGPHATSAGWRRAAHALPPCRLRRTLLLLLADTGAEHSAPPLAEWFEEPVMAEHPPNRQSGLLGGQHLCRDFRRRLGNKTVRAFVRV